MTYPANIVPTMNQVTSGELEPTSKAFKGYVGMVRMAPYYGFAMTITGIVFGAVGIAPMDTTRIVIQGVGTAILMAFVGMINVVRKRKPSIEQIRRLTHLVTVDRSLAAKVNAFGERDFTFKRMQRFIMDHAGRANEIEMAKALEQLEDTVSGHPARS